MQLRDYQQECINTIQSKPPGRYLIQMATGLGKCFALGTPILMFDGSIKAVEHVRHGDRVMGPDSRPRIVQGLARGREVMYRVTPKKGDSYIVNESHILSLKITGMGGGKHVTDCNRRKYASGDICNISVSDYMRSSNTFKHCAKGWRASVNFTEQPVLIPPYILGIWLGDGTSTGTQVTTMEPEVVRSLHNYARSNDMVLKVVDSKTTGKAITYSIVGIERKWGCNGFRAALKEYALAAGKYIPSQYLKNTNDVRLELLAGLLDSDGYLVDGCCFEIATVSERMASDIVYLARSLGLAAYEANKVVNGVTYHRINISGDTHLIPTRVERRKAKVRRQKKDVLHVGITVESVGVGDYYGFELIGPDRLFLLGDFTVTHNTVTFANIPRQGHMLILSHREELVRQPLKYFDCPRGVEMAGEYATPMDEVVSASVQTLTRRLDRF